MEYAEYDATISRAEQRAWLQRGMTDERTAGYQEHRQGLGSTWIDAETCACYPPCIDIIK